MANTAISAAQVALCDPMEMNTYFHQRSCYLENRIEKYLEKNPSTSMWLNKVVESEAFPQGEGLTMTKFIFHSSPAPQVWTNELFKPFAGSTDGSGTNPADPDYVAPVDACTTECSTVNYGMQTKNWSLQKACISTAWLCAMDLWYKWGVAETLNAWAENLARISRSIAAQWNRDKTIEHSQIIVANPEYRNSISMFAAKGILPRIPAGGACLPQLLYLEQLYDYLSIQYADAAVGRTGGGAPLFAVCCGRELAYAFRRNNAALREDDRYSDANNEFYAEGFTRGEFTYHGFVFLVDVETPRFIEDPDRTGYFQRVWPYEESSTTIGTRWDYIPGGAFDSAPYELLLFMPRGQFTNVSFSLNTNPGGGTNFESQNFTGQVSWQKFSSPSCEDEDGLKGRYRMKWMRGTKPGTHDFGLGMIFRRPDREAEARLLCSDTGLCDPCTGTDVTYPADGSMTCASVAGEPTQLLITGDTDMGLGTPAVDDTIYVTFDSGVEVAATVVEFETTGDESIILDFGFAIDCDHEGGVASLSTTTACIGVVANYFGDSPNGSGKKVLRVTLVPGAVLPNTAESAAYTASFDEAHSGTPTATLLGTSVVDGVTNYHFEFTSAFVSANSLTSITSLGGIVCLTI